MKPKQSQYDVITVSSF
uniref:Uncharacterized protein n=1 Tax=Arundo donax TaxID=35708 RepID=A0A0A9BEN9_ARUDO